MTEPQEVYFVGICEICENELYYGMDFYTTSTDKLFCAECLDELLNDIKNEGENDESFCKG